MGLEIGSISIKVNIFNIYYAAIALGIIFSG
jgi:hypothetical protein